MSNYKIILSETELKEFIDWLPLLYIGECYYVALFARKKYHSSAKNDKSQCKRFTATNKQWLYRKIKQLEIAEDCYTNKDGTPVHNDSLALYITVNPRHFKIAQKNLLIRLANIITQDIPTLNPSSMALSEIQKSKSRTCYVDFDFDNITSLDTSFKDIINREAYTILHTRGGFHLLVDPLKVTEQYKQTWYNALASNKYCDNVGDNMIPIPGCTQGGFIPVLDV